jgi:hypothetical protein
MKPLSQVDYNSFLTIDKSSPPIELTQPKIFAKTLPTWEQSNA